MSKVFLPDPTFSSYLPPTAKPSAKSSFNNPLFLGTEDIQKKARHFCRAFFFIKTEQGPYFLTILCIEIPLSVVSFMV